MDKVDSSFNELGAEVFVMRRLDHPNLAKVYSAFTVGSVLWIVQPLEIASCYSIIKKSNLFPRGIKDETLLATILSKVLKGLAYFHEQGMVHRDIKAGNILLSNCGEVKLCDFGVSGTLFDNGIQKKRRTITGTLHWMAPEIFQRTGHDTKADIWSFAITAMELAFGRPPYESSDPMKVMFTILEKDPPTLASYKEKHSFSRGFASMLSKCLRKNPKKRPTAKKLLTHRFFRRARDSAHVYEKIISQYSRRSTARDVPLALEELRVKPSKSKSKPISVESWIFSEKNQLGGKLTNFEQDFDQAFKVEELKQADSLTMIHSSTLSKIWSWNSPLSRLEEVTISPSTLSRIWSWNSPAFLALPLDHQPQHFSIWRWSFGWTSPCPKKNKKRQNAFIGSLYSSSPLVSSDSLPQT